MFTCRRHGSRSVIVAEQVIAATSGFSRIRVKTGSAGYSSTRRFMKTVAQPLVRGKHNDSWFRESSWGRCFHGPQSPRVNHKTLSISRSVLPVECVESSTLTDGSNICVAGPESVSAFAGDVLISI